MEKVYISWTFQNWVTIILMFLIAGLVVNIAAAAFDKVKGA